jgi:hypothetical protein
VKTIFFEKYPVIKLTKIKNKMQKNKISKRKREIIEFCIIYPLHMIILTIIHGS